MPITYVKYSRLVNLGNYENERFEAGVNLAEGQTPDQGMAETRVFVSRANRHGMTDVEIVPPEGPPRSERLNVRHVNVAHFHDIPRPFVLHFPRGKNYPEGIIRVGPKWPMPDDHKPAQTGRREGA